MLRFMVLILASVGAYMLTRYYLPPFSFWGVSLSAWLGGSILVIGLLTGKK